MLPPFSAPPGNTGHFSMILALARYFRRLLLVFGASWYHAIMGDYDNLLAKFQTPLKPFKITEELVQKSIDAIELVGNGASMKNAVGTLGMKPLEFRKVLEAIPALSEAYAQAKRSYAECIASEILEISEDNTREFRRAALQISARKWLASKYDPLLYGEKLDLNVQRSVSINEALKEAKMRTVSGPSADQKTIEVLQTAEDTGKNKQHDTDNESEDDGDDSY